MRGKRPWAAVDVVEDVTEEMPSAVKSAARALRIIEFFDEIRRGARANEIVERLGFPQSSTSLLLNSMRQLGYLDFDTTKKTYIPSIRTAVLSTWRDTGCFRDGTMLDVLETLVEETALSAGLIVRNGIFARYLQIVQSDQEKGVHIPLSVRRYVVKMAGGIVLVAKLTDPQIKKLSHLTQAEQSVGASRCSHAEVMERVKVARDKGYYLSDGLVSPSNGSIGILLPKTVTGGWQDMALTLGGRRENVVDRETELCDRMSDAIRKLSPNFSISNNIHR